MISKLTTLLTLPAIYRLFGYIVLGDAYKIYMADYVKPAKGEKVLDVGCGPGDILDYLPAVDYLGFDINPRYIEDATRRFGARGRFLCGDVGLQTLGAELGTFDLVLATGVLHHLDDQRARRLFELAHAALKPGGRLLTYDGCYVPEQGKLARFVLNCDRGKFVRRRREYETLDSAVFPKVDSFVRHDLLRIPYTHLIMRSVKDA